MVISLVKAMLLVGGVLCFKTSSELKEVLDGQYKLYVRNGTSSGPPARGRRANPPGRTLSRTSSCGCYCGNRPGRDSRLLHMFNDFLYKGGIPAEVLEGITVLLPKTAGDPQAWGDTRPITLSSTVLKWFACIQDDQPLQWAARGKQAP